MKKRLIYLFLASAFVFNTYMGGDVFAKETLDTIFQRKSVRNYIDKDVSKQQLETLMRAAMAAPTAMDKRPWAFVAITDKEKLTSLAQMPYCGMLAYASAAILVCGDSSKFLEGTYSDFWIQDCSAATQNILLAAEDMDLGAVWLGGYPSEERMKLMRNVLSLPENIIPLSLVSIGYPAGTEKPKDKYDETNIHWEKWSN